MVLRHGLLLSLLTALDAPDPDFIPLTKQQMFATGTNDNADITDDQPGGAGE